LSKQCKGMNQPKPFKFKIKQKKNLVKCFFDIHFFFVKSRKEISHGIFCKVTFNIYGAKTLNHTELMMMHPENVEKDAIPPAY
jgi:hypothetical protein